MTRRPVGIPTLMNPSSTISEHEAKFEVDRDYDLPDLRGLVGRTDRLPEQHLLTVYFDTDDLRLAQRGISLRHRITETADGSETEESWTLKLPEASHDDIVARSETSWPGERAAIPPQALAIVRGLVRRAPLRPVAELNTTRRRLQLIEDHEIAPFAEIDDDLVTVVGGPGDGSWFRQIELELTPDHLAADVKALLKCLRRSGAKPTKQSKLSLAVGERPPRQGRRGAKNRKRQTISDMVKTAIASNLDRLLDHDYRLRLAPDRPDPEDIHQARVATRKLRSNLKMFAAVIDPVWLGHTAEDLRWIAEILGQIRDLDVLAENVTPVDSEARHTLELVQAVGSQRNPSVKRLSSALGSARYLDLLDRLNAAKRRPPLVPASNKKSHKKRRDGMAPEEKASDVLPKLIGHEWRSLQRKARKADTRSNDQRLHEIRIRAKRLRYAAETAAPVIGKSAKRVAKGAATLQDLLGELRDSAAAEAWLRDQVTGVSPAAGLLSGALVERHQTRQLELRRRWPSAWKGLQRASKSLGRRRRS